MDELLSEQPTKPLALKLSVGLHTTGTTEPAHIVHCNQQTCKFLHRPSGCPHVAHCYMISIYLFMFSPLSRRLKGRRGIDRIDNYSNLPELHLLKMHSSHYYCIVSSVITKPRCALTYAKVWLERSPRRGYRVVFGLYPVTWDYSSVCFSLIVKCSWALYNCHHDAVSWKVKGHIMLFCWRQYKKHNMSFDFSAI